MGVSAPAGTNWSGEMLGRGLERQTPEMAAAAMLAEKNKLNRNTRLSWNKGEIPLDKPTEGRYVGEVCLSLPYVFVDRRYYIQNCRIFRSNGTEITLEDAFKELDGKAYIRLTEAYEEHLRRAVIHDPSLCKHCKKYRTTGTEDMLQHLVNDDPEIVSGRVRQAPVVEAETTVSVTDKIAPWCEPCYRTFKNDIVLRLHRLKVHDKAA